MGEHQQAAAAGLNRRELAAAERDGWALLLQQHLYVQQRRGETGRPDRQTDRLTDRQSVCIYRGHADRFAAGAAVVEVEQEGSRRRPLVPVPRRLLAEVGMSFSACRAQYESPMAITTATALTSMSEVRMA